MSRLVLVHGNAVGIKFPMRDRQTEYASFKVFEPMIDANEAVLYKWHYVNEEFNLFQTLNPFQFHAQYATEQKYCSSLPASQNLNQFLQVEQSPKIVCHSMGCYLLLNMINSLGLPASVRSIFLAQSDFDTNFEIKNKDVLDRIAQKTLTIYNYYCPWDQMLLLSTGANFKVPAGLIGAKQECITNRLFASTNTFNIHHSTVNSKGFLAEVINC
jgi:hypothetical protein